MLAAWTYTSRVFLGAVLLVVSVMLGVNCVSLLQLDGYSDATVELCELIGQCFGDDYYSACSSHSGARLTDADATERSAWLLMFADDKCLENCTNAYKCLDQNPVCGATGLGCAQTEQCCGFSTGVSSCNGSCEVCAGALARCECKLAGEDCEEDFECCTEICLAGSCSDVVCAPDGSDCTVNDECCSQYCDDSLCTEPQCAADGSICTSASQCCGGFCVGASGASELVCSSADCVPVGGFCDESDNGDAVCCSGNCDAAFNRCASSCSGPNESCSTDGDCCDSRCESDNTCACLDAGAPCTNDSDCCGEVCSDNFKCRTDGCDAVGTSCSTQENCCFDCVDGACCDYGSCDHTVCQKGGPLKTDCLCTACNADSENCVATVCAQLPDCCCTAWTQDCVDEAKQNCGATCEQMAQPGG